MALERRIPGETDLRIFTSEVVREGRHRVDRTRVWLRVVREPITGCPSLRLLVLARPLRTRLGQ